MIVLSQLDTRYFEPISGRSNWTFDFVVFKKGNKDLITQSSVSGLYKRSVNVELDLEEGSYVVHVRVDYSDRDTILIWTQVRLDRAEYRPSVRPTHLSAMPTYKRTIDRHTYKKGWRIGIPAIFRGYSPSAPRVNPLL